MSAGWDFFDKAERRSQATRSGSGRVSAGTETGAERLCRAWARRDAWVSLGLILVLELLAAAAYLSYRKKSFTILYSVGLANLITTSLSWLFLVRYVKETAFLWLFCLLAETLIIRLMNPRKISLNDSFMLSLTANVTSYSLGMIISFMLAPLIF